MRKGAKASDVEEGKGEDYLRCNNLFRVCQMHERLSEDA